MSARMQVLEAMRRMQVKAPNRGITQLEIRTYTKLSPSAVSESLAFLVQSKAVVRRVDGGYEALSQEEWENQGVYTRFDLDAEVLDAVRKGLPSCEPRPFDISSYLKTLSATYEPPQGFDRKVGKAKSYRGSSAFLIGEGVYRGTVDKG